LLQAFVAALLITFATPSLAAEEVPQFDIEATCRAAQPLGPEDTDPFSGCMSDEKTAEDDLHRQWSSFNPDSRATCVRETGIGGYPSYVEVLTCMQMFGAATSPAPLRWRRPGG
jgi:hypothetical protein